MIAAVVTAACAVRAFASPRGGLIVLGGLWMFAALVPMVLTGHAWGGSLLVAGFSILLAGVLVIVLRNEILVICVLAVLLGLGIVGARWQTEVREDGERYWRLVSEHAPEAAWPREIPLRLLKVLLITPLRWMKIAQ